MTSVRLLSALVGALMAPTVGAFRHLPVARAEASKPRRAVPTARYYGITFGYPTGPGWTIARVKRMARKVRNQRRHKLACRGARHV